MSDKFIIKLNNKNDNKKSFYATEKKLGDGSIYTYGSKSKALEFESLDLAKEALSNNPGLEFNTDVFDVSIVNIKEQIVS